MTERFVVQHSTSGDLNAIAHCYERSFPRSLSTALGHRYVVRTLEWYLSTDTNFLFHVVDRIESRVVGFCGGMANDGVHKRGSASEMIQFAYDEGVKSLLKRPWILFHKEMRSKYALAWKNMKRRWYKKGSPSVYRSRRIEPFVGLVVIGVDPDYQNQGIGQLLLKEFDDKAKKMGYSTLRLTVKAENRQAVRAYEKSGWQLNENKGMSFSLTKKL